MGHKIPISWHQFLSHLLFSEEVTEENGREKSPAFCFTKLWLLLGRSSSKLGQCKYWCPLSKCVLMTMDACETYNNFSCRTYDLPLNPRHTFLSLWAKDFKQATKMTLMWSAQSRAWEIFALKVTARLSLWTICLSRCLTLVASEISIPCRDFHTLLGPALNCMNKVTSPSACSEVSAI